jgi:hypothetical protein
MSAAKAKKQRKKGGGQAAAPAPNFWAANVPEDELVGLGGTVTPSAHPTALVKSLGQPPLPGQNRVAGMYFDAVYEKAAHFATALATANQLLDVDERDLDDADNDAADDDDG